jgi:hypothetical protein
MNADSFYEQVRIGFGMSPEQRHRHYSKLHTSVLNDYVRAIRFTVTDLAEQPAPDSDDTRPLKLIVAQMAEWDRFALAAATDILIGLSTPRLVHNLHGYVDADGQHHNFDNIDAFNAYQLERYTDVEWIEVQRLAIDLAETLHALFSTPKLITVPRLENTARTTRTLKNGETFKDLTMGWALWLIVMEHSAVEHAVELRIG